MASKRQELVAICLDSKGKVISSAANNYEKSHPLQAYFAKKVGQEKRIYLHAEISAILRARGRKIHKIMVSRYNKDGQPMLAKPCAACEEAIRAFGIERVEYTVG
jgi:tRNA(Arg) A34 adenosine deaminase TadA